MQLNNNTILITGGASGIGLAMTKTFAQLGNNIIVTGRDTNKLAGVKVQLPKVHTIECDLTQQVDIDKLVHFVEQQHPTLNILINNAGIQYNYKLVNEPNALHKVEHEIYTNLLAPIKLTTLLLPLLEQNKNAAIVNVSSALGIVPKQSAPIYSATKAGLHIFTKALRYQLTNTKLFEIIPSLVDTDMTKGRGKGKISPEELVEEFITAFEQDKYEISIGKVKLLRLLARISPKLADYIMSNK